MREARATIHLNHLLNNLEVIQQMAPSSQVVAMVKADAYGHGLIPVSKTLAPHVASFGVCCFQEALQLRKAGIKQDIILMEGVFSPQELTEANALNLSVVIHHQQQLEWLLAEKKHFEQSIWLKLNSGMNRLGFNVESFQIAYQQLTDLGHDPILMTHLACADEYTHPLNTNQLTQFNAVTDGLSNAKSCLNSAGILNFPDHQHDYVRPGLALYGIPPFINQSKSYPQLKPVMTLEAEVIAIHHLKAGEQVGYGAVWTAERDSKIATVSIGYGDGYPRDVPNGTPVCIGEQHCPTIGNVSMDMMAIDITEAVQPVKLGQAVCLWGEENRVETVSHCINRIPYELVTQITARPRKIYKT